MLDQRTVKEFLNYDKVTGDLIWKVYREHKANIGDVAGW